ncbi:hypothetical protein [Haloferula rosea]|uniref:Uncharacterized protein n=1 Tax=Haloferula rosea TaxID=490093 RepID=A0A934RC08_9BACT|nr:hypothetical protein [Haloferula rosea]MBK1828854.1 hypothetical protein [Haloferula rosea]
MKLKQSNLATLLALGFLTTTVSAQTFIYEEEFDGTGNGYNPDSMTALAGDDDWVDFANRIGNNFSGNEGYFTAAGGTESVITGGATSNDPQVRTDFAVGINKSEVGRVELRVRIDKDQDSDYDAADALVAADVSLFWGTNTYVNPGAANGNPNVSINFGNADEVVAEADGWHRFIWTDKGGLSGGGAGTTQVNSFRLDPVNGNNGASFEVDYLKIEESTLIQVDPVDPVGPEFTLRQEWNWNTDGDQEGWTAGANGHFTISGVSGGLLSGVSSDGDPQIISPSFEVLDVESGRFVIEVGLVVDVADTSSKRLFWGLNGAGPVGGQALSFPPLPTDGLLHVVRLNLDDLINDRITSLRFDPSTTSGITTNVDFIRIYSEGPEIPFIPPPVAELDPAPLGPEFILQQEWLWDTEDDFEGWTLTNLFFADPNDADTGVFDSSIFAESVGTDPQLQSPNVNINAPASGQFVVEIEYATDFSPATAGQLFWADASGGPGVARSITTPSVPNDGASHTVRVTFTDNIDTVLNFLRFDPTNADAIYFGIDAVRIYTNGPPLSSDAPKIASFTYDSSTGDAEAVLVGNPTTVYTFVSAADLDFSASSPITLTGATVGTLSGGGVETDGSGNATVQFNLGTGPANFLRAED